MKLLPAEIEMRQERLVIPTSDRRERQEESLSTQKGVAPTLRKVREEWGTQFYSLCPRLKRRAIRLRVKVTTIRNT
jgi:hypothetical protein